MSSDLEDLLTQLFTDSVGPERVAEAERVPLLHDLWTTIAELDLPGIGISEAAGGSGGSVADVVTLLSAGGRYAVPLPLLEHHLAVWLVSAAGEPISSRAPWSVAPPQESLVVDGTTITGTLRDVAWGGAVERVVALVDDRVVVVDPAHAAVTAGRDIAGQPRDTLVFDRAPAAVFLTTTTAADLEQRGAVLRAAQMAGAMAAIYELTQRYTAQREQFGRPIGKFQAVRRHLVFLAQMAVMTQVSVDRAAAALEAGRDCSFDVLATKLIADQNAVVSIRSGHQAHGAIGMTREYPLHNLTRRLNAWRGDWGSELELATRIGEAVSVAGEIARIATDAGVLTV